MEGLIDELARAASERGELVLLRRDDESTVLRVNGVFAMDDAETTSERCLATAALAATRGDALRCVVGGLGLGYTLAELLRSPRSKTVTVVEIEPDLVAWHRSGAVPPPQGVAVLDDARVTVVISDVRDVVTQLVEDVDVIVLDVDNGRGFLVYDTNAGLYQHDFLARCAEALAPGGVVAMWSAAPDRELYDVLDGVFDDAQLVPIPVTLDGRTTAYHLLLGWRLP